MILVRKDKEGVWRRAPAEFTVDVMQSTCTITRGDGTVINDAPCDPYPVPTSISTAGVMNALAKDAWTDADLEAHGLKVAERFQAPDGKRAIGLERFEEGDDGLVRQVLDTEDEPPPVILAEEVKAEARRRIVAILPEHQQNNLLAEGLKAVVEHGADVSKWPVEVQALVAPGLAAFARIKVIRAKSDEIEAMDPIPLDYADDKFWR